jgi:peptidylprolyl isomerase
VRFAVVLVAVAACQGGGDSGKRKESAPKATPSAGRPPKGTLTQVPPPFDAKTPPADAETLPDGLAYKTITEGTGAQPGPNDGVQIKYAAWRTNGTTFATTEPSPDPTTRWLFTEPPGFVEAMRKMKVGGKAMFWMPAALTTTPDRPHGQAEPLSYRVELVGVIAAPATPPDVGAPPADAKKARGDAVWKLAVHGGGADHPRGWDKVTVAYTGWNDQGTIVDSTEIHGTGVTMETDQLPDVFADVVPAMVEGDRARVWFPGTALAHGANAPKGTVCYELQLTAITKRAEPPAAPKDVAKPPDGAKQTPKGVSYVVLTHGTGAAHPTTNDQVTVNFTSWTTDGKRFDSTIPDHAPKVYRVTGVIPGMTDALMQMVEGDEWRIWIPEPLAYNGARGKPAGMLVYDLQLLKVEPKK